MNRYQTLKVWRDTFAREADSPRYRLSRIILITGFGIALLYTVLLTLFEHRQAGDWLQVSRPVTELAGFAIPAIGRISSDLTQRGHGDRAGYIANVIAFQWLASGFGWLLATVLLILDRERLSRAFAAARERTSGSIPKPTLMNFFLPLILVAGLFAWWPFDSHSFERGRGHYDLADGDGGLYFPFLAFTALWWLCLYWVAREMIALFGTRGAD